MTDDNDTTDDVYRPQSDARDEGLPGFDVSVWTNYKEGKVGLGLPQGDVLVSPAKAREIADSMEAKFDIEDAVEMGYPTDELIDHLRRAADQAESGTRSEQAMDDQVEAFLDAIEEMAAQEEADDE